MEKKKHFCENNLTHFQFSTLSAVSFVMSHLWLISIDAADGLALYKQQAVIITNKNNSVTYTCMYIWTSEWVNSLWPSDTIWHHRSSSTLVQKMAYCLNIPSHYRATTYLGYFWEPHGAPSPMGSQKYPWFYWQKCITWTNANLSRVIPLVTCWMQLMSMNQAPFVCISVIKFTKV